MRTLLLLSAAALAILSTPPRAEAQPAGRVAGAVVASGSGATIAGASVVVRSVRDTTLVQGALTGAAGRFVVERLAAGAYTVRVSHVGYAPATRALQVEPQGGTVDLGTIELAAEAIEIEGVEVRGERSPVVLAPDRTIYRTEDMPAVSGGTATDLLRGVPELEVDIEGKVSLRGTESLTVHINGRPSPLQGEALQNFLRQLPADRVERVEVVPNPSARYDPEGMAGILNIVLKQGANVGLGGSVSLNAGTRGDLGGSGQLAYQRGRLSLFGNAIRSSRRSDQTFTSHRQDLLSVPLTSLEQDGTSRNVNGFDMVDVSAELQASERVLVWSSLRAYRNESAVNGVTAYSLLTPAVLLERYDSPYRMEWRHGSRDLALGGRRAVEADRNQVSVELRRSTNDGGNDQWRGKELLALGGLPIEAAMEESWLDTAESDDETSLQVDFAHPVGWGGKLELGYRGSRQGSDRENEPSGAAPSIVRTAFTHRERFHSAYATLGGRFGRLSVQGGLRGESADTELELPTTGERYGNDYTSLFPSANVALDLGGGRQARLAYSKRIQRPWIWILNPVSSDLDPLNRFEGNPNLKPKYTHSWSLDLTWTGPLGTLTAAPYYRRTVDNWDQVVRVEDGVFVTTWDNVASIDSYGSSFTASMRPVGVLSGFANLSAYHEEWDASNVSEGLTGGATRWSGNVNASVRPTPELSLQAMARYSAPRDMPQGTMSSSTMTNFGVRQQLWDGKASIDLSVTDPFDRFRFRFETRDRTHVATSLNDLSIRSVQIRVTYNFGKPPRQSRPQGTTEEGREPPRSGG